MKWAKCGGAFALLLLGCAAWSASGRKGPDNVPPVPAQRIALESLGLTGTPTPGLLRTRAAIATLDFIDTDHVLLTFAIRPLLTRHGDDDAPVPDCVGRAREDRVVRAEIVDLHSGKVDAQQDWRLYDRDWYLLALGNGEFLLRRGARLSVLDARDGHFAARPFADSKQAVVYGQASGGVLVLEFEHEAHTAEQHAKMAHDAKLFDARPPVEQANAFGWKLPLEQPADHPLFHILLPEAERLAANDVGLLGVDGGADKFELFFRPYSDAAKGRVQIRRLRSDCRPAARFLRQDIALISICENGGPWDEAVKIEGKDSKQIWQHAIAGGLPDFQTSEDGRRFVVQTLGADTGPGEEKSQPGQVQVFDVDTGARVLATVLEPVYAPDRIAALSHDAMRLAVLRKGALEIYDLPPVASAPPAMKMIDAPKKKK